MPWKTQLVLFLTLGLAAQVAGAKSPAREAEESIDEGRKLIAEKRFDAAVAAFSKALRVRPDLLPALIGKAHAHLAAGQSTLALTTCDAAVRLSSESWEAYDCRSRAYAAMNQPATAITDLDEAIRLRPEDPDMLRRRAAMHLQAGDNAAAALDLAEIVRLGKASAEDHVARAEVLFRLNRYSEAAAGLQEVAQTAAATPAAFLLRARCFLLLKRYADAVRDLDKAVELKHEEARALELRVQARLELEDLTGALDDIRRLTGVLPAGEASTRQVEEWHGRVLFKLSSIADAPRRLALAERIQFDQADTAHYDELQRLLFAGYQSSAPDKALRIAESCIAQGRATVPMYLHAAMLLAASQKEPERAVRYCDRGLALSKDTNVDQAVLRELLAVKASAYMQIKDYQQADGTLRQLLGYQGAPEWRVNLLMMLAYANYRLAAPLKAIEFYRMAQEIPGEHQKKVAEYMTAIKSEYGLTR